MSELVTLNAATQQPAVLFSTPPLARVCRLAFLQPSTSDAGLADEAGYFLREAAWERPVFITVLAVEPPARTPGGGGSGGNSAAVPAVLKPQPTFHVALYSSSPVEQGEESSVPALIESFKLGGFEPPGLLPTVGSAPLPPAAISPTLPAARLEVETVNEQVRSH